MTGVRVLEFDLLNFVNFEADIHFAEDEGIVQVRFKSTLFCSCTPQVIASCLVPRAKLTDTTSEWSNTHWV